VTISIKAGKTLQTSFAAIPKLLPAPAAIVNLLKLSVKKFTFSGHQMYFSEVQPLVPGI
jgi:hypothetical protein